MMDGKSIRNKLIGSNEERAVSPVIGVILMVAITVILAAVIAAFVMDMGDLDDSAPSATYNWEEETDPTSGASTSATFSHTGGDDIKAENIVITIGSSSADLTSTGSYSSGDTLGAGDKISFTENGASAPGSLEYAAGDTIEVVWESDSTSSILSDFETSS